MPKAGRYKHNIIIDRDDKTADIDILSKKYGRFLVKISQEDKLKIKAHQWHVYVKKCGYVSIKASVGKGNNPLRLHSFIMGPIPNGYHCIDHKNGNTLDNSRDNLRFVTYTENALNQVKCKGFQKKKQGNITRLQVKCSYKRTRYTFGHFPDTDQGKLDARKRYVAAVKFMHNFQTFDYEKLFLTNEDWQLYIQQFSKYFDQHPKLRLIKLISF